MKRSLLSPLLSLPLLGLACTGVHAQGNNVTLYGVADLAVEHVSNVGAGSDSLLRIPGLTGSAPSRLGVRGAEDLGGGLKAVFTVEMGFGMDTGALNQGGRAFGRQAFVGLTGAWGSLTLGRQYTMLFWSSLDSDILGPHMFGSGSLDSYIPNARADNSIAYRGSFGGFTIGATYSFGRDTINAGPSPSGTNCSGENPADSRQCRERSAMIKYDTKSWGVALAVDELRGGPGAFAGLANSSLSDRRSVATGWATFGPVKVGAGLIARRNEASVATPRSDLVYLGAAYTITPQLGVQGQIFRLDFDNSPNKTTLFALRGTYGLSKRTTLYATVGHISNDGALAVSVSGAQPGANPGAGESQTGLGVGIRHLF